MTTTVACIDNDIIHKLCATDLIEEAFAAIGCGSARRVVLPTARYKLLPKDPKRGSEKYGEATFNRMKAFIETADTPSAQPNSDDLAKLSGKHGIDQGEAILFSLVARDPDSVLLTGDKKSLTALVREPDCQPLVELLRGRVIVFEQLALRVMDAHGFSAVRDRLAAGAMSDTVLRVAFGSGPLTEEGVARDALHAYAKDLLEHPSRLLRAL